MNRGFGFAPNGPRDGFYHAGHGGTPALAWVIFGLLLALLLISLVSLALDVYARSQRRSRRFGRWLPGQPGPGRAMAMLDARYVQGELSREDYLQMRGDVLGRDASEEPTEVVPPPEPPAPRRRRARRRPAAE